MNKSDLDHRLKSYYQAQQLSEETLSELVAMSETRLSDHSQVKQSYRWFWQRNLAVAAALLILIFSVVQFTQNMHLSTDELALLVSKEIALNHNKRLAPEFVAEDYRALTAQMDKLDFTLLASSRIEQAELKLVGARYCSIHGQLATQLKLLDKKGDLHTLYQTQLNDELGRLPEGEYMINGIQVQQWQEAGLFFAFAKSPQ